MEKRNSRQYTGHGRQKTITTLSGNTTVVYPVEAVTLGQAAVAVGGNKVYFIAALWNKMSGEEVDGANEAAFVGKQWIEDHAAADTKGSDMRALQGGATCCEHTGFPQHLAHSIKKGRALIFRRVKPQDQMADSITVGTVGSSLPKCEVCTNWRILKGVVPRFRKDGSIYQIDQRCNGEVRDNTISKRLSGSIAPSPGTSGAPTPRSFTTCPSEYDFDPMQYTNLEDLEHLEDLEDLEGQQEANDQLREEAREVEGRAASEQLIRHARLWESATPEGSPNPSIHQATEAEEPIVYEEGTQWRTGAWVSNGHLAGDAISVSSASTVIQRSKGNRRERARSTPGRGEYTGEIEAVMREELERMGTNMTNLAERAQEELREAVEAGLTVIRDEVRMQLEERAERESKLRAEEGENLKREQVAMLRKIEKQS